MISLLETPEDRSDFEDIYRKTHRKLLHTAQGILHDRYDAEEIVHDVFARLAENFHKYRGKPSREMLSLGIVMTRNASINLLHKRERHKEILVEPCEPAWRAGADVLEDVLREENREELRDAIRHLKPEERDTLILRYYHGMSYREIGKVLGIKAKTVDMRLYRIKAKLRETLLEE